LTLREYGCSVSRLVLPKYMNTRSSTHASNRPASNIVVPRDTDVSRTNGSGEGDPDDNSDCFQLMREANISRAFAFITDPHGDKGRERGFDGSYNPFAWD
jgi:hypothetical protein